jgi:hypothetical protein
VLLRAIAGAEPPLAGARLELVGDGPLRDELEREAVRLGLGERVWFHGSVPEPEVAAVLAEADVFALPSIIAPDGDMEGIPSALIEAMAAGLPAVSTYQSGVPELIEDGHTGFLAQPGDVDGCARRSCGRSPRRTRPRAPARRAPSSRRSSARSGPPAGSSSCSEASAPAQVHLARLPVDRHLAARQHGDDGPQEDLEVQQNRAPAGVHQVERDLLREDRADVVRQRVVLVEDPALRQERDLREADEPGPHAEDLVVLLAVMGDEVGGLRPRADEAHVAAQHVQELRQLVELRAREEGADAREAVVLVRGERDARGRVVHLAELEHPQPPAVAADAVDLEERGAGGVEPDEQGDDQQQRQQRYRPVPILVVGRSISE